MTYGLADIMNTDSLKCTTSLPKRPLHPFTLPSRWGADGNTGNTQVKHTPTSPQGGGIKGNTQSMSTVLLHNPSVTRVIVFDAGQVTTPIHQTDYREDRSLSRKHVDIN